MAMDEPPRLETHYYYDTFTKTVLVGQDAFDIHISEGNHPADIYELGEVLRDTSIPIPEPDEVQRLDTSTWALKDYVEYGRWLSQIVKPPSKHKEKVLNKDIIKRAGRLGIGPIHYEIISEDRFQNLRRFYEAVGLKNVHKIENYNRVLPDWSRYDFLSYLKRVSKKLDKKPTRDELQLLHEKRPQSRPSPAVIQFRLGSLRQAMELIGYPDIISWQKEDFIRWGVNFIKANNGLLPVQTSIEYLSSKSFGPSDSKIRDVFGSIEAFRMAIVNAYITEQKEKISHKQSQLKSLEKLLETGELPDLLFDEIDEDERLLRFAKFQVIEELAPVWQESTKVTICINDNSNKGFIGAIRKRNNAITAGDIENTAVSLGVFDYIWPPDESFLENLKVQASPRAIKLSQLYGLDIKESEKE